MYIDIKNVLLNYVVKFGAYAYTTETCNSENIIDFIGWLSGQEELPTYVEAVINEVARYTVECHIEKTQPTVSGLLGHINRNS